MGGENDIVMLSPKKQHATIHFHTEDGLSPLSHQDIGNSLGVRKEKLSIAISKKETWLMQKKNPQKVFASKEINKITKDIEKLEITQKKKMRAEYDRKQHKIKKIKDPQERKLMQERFDESLNNEFLDKHNQELGNRILDYFDNHKDLRVRRIMNTPTKRGSIESLHNLKVNKKIYNMYGTLKHSTPINSKVKDIDKYALTEPETKQYEKLKKLKEKGELKFLDKRKFEELADRKEFNELRNKILLEGGNPNDVFSLSGAEGVRYERLFKQFKDWEPLEKIEIEPIKINKKQVFKKEESFKLNPTEKKYLKQMEQNNASLTTAEREYKIELRDKKTLNNLHKKLINEGLDEINSRSYVELYSKYKNKWDLPDLDINLKFTTKRKYYSREQTYKEATEFRLTKKENEELYKLEKKELFGQKLSSQELKRKELLQAQDEFAYLNALNKKHGGLNYEDYSKFKKLYKQVKTNIKVDKNVLEQPLSNYKSDIPLDKNPKNLKKFKGSTDDGLLPNGEKITDYFTKDARDMTIREQQVAHRWLGSDYKAFTNFEIDCGRDVKKFEKWIYDMAKAYEKDNSLKYYEYYYKACRNNISGRLNKSLAKDLAHSIAYDVPVLDDILNNQLKQGITLWRVQENHNLPSIVVGDIMDFPNFRSAAISKEGALWFSATNSKPMKYLIEIEAPTGTRGAFLAPIKQGTWFAPPEIGVDHPLHGQNYAREMEFLLKECKVEVIKFGGKPVKGAMGEDLIPIKLRVVGYK